MDKGFLNVHQLKASHLSSAGDYLTERIGKESQFIEVHLSDFGDSKLKRKINKILPKYSYLVVKNNPYNRTTKFIQEYGHILARLKDQIKRRATFSLSDSLGTKSSNEIHTFRFKGKDKGKLKKNADTNWEAEAQIWGSLLPSDIEYFLVNCPGFNKVKQSVFKHMMSSNIPVYKCLFKDKRTMPYKGKHLTNNDLKLFPKKDVVEIPKLKKIIFKEKDGTLYVTIKVRSSIDLNYLLLSIYDTKGTKVARHRLFFDSKKELDTVIKISGYNFRKIAPAKNEYRYKVILTNVLMHTLNKDGNFVIK